MYTLLAAAALAACMGGPCPDGDCGYHRCFPGFAPDIENGLLVTPPPEDVTGVFTPGYSENNARLWIDQDLKDPRSVRTWHRNPGKVAYGAAGPECEVVRLRANTLVVEISPWERVEEEGLERWEAARQQWLAERGYTGGVRTFVNPKRTRAIAAQMTETAAACEPAQGTPHPSATIRLRKPDESRGVIRGVDAGVAGGVKIIAGDEPVRVSWPMTARAEVVERAIARGWTESEDGEKALADARK